jgi:hypothetical protein
VTGYQLDFDVRKSVHHHAIQINCQPDATVSQVYYLTFICRSTRFGRLHAHHQELTNALTASGFTLERGGSSVVGRVLAGRPDHEQQRCYHHVPR